MKFNIYDCYNAITEVNIDENIDDIEKIQVILLSGDELVCIRIKNGEKYKFDSSDSRTIHFYDNSYILNTPEEIEWFINWMPNEYITNSYARADEYEEKFGQ